MGQGWKQVWEDVRRSVGQSKRDPAGEVSPPPVTVPVGDPGPGTRRAPRRWLRVAGFALVAALAFYIWSREQEPTPPSPEVVATYDGGQLTVEDLRQHLAFLVPDQRMREQLRTPEDYRHLVYEMIGDALVQRWAAGRNLEQDQDFRHVMQHLDEEIGMGRLAQQLHEGNMGVNQADVGAYYEANREAFAERTLGEVQGEIRARLQAERERSYEEEYLQGLKQRAVITRDFSLLEVPEPTETELRASFRASGDRYLLPARAVVDELRFPVVGDETAARERAERAVVLLRSGTEFFAVAAELSDPPVTEQGAVVLRGTRGPAYDAVVFSAQPGRISDVFRSGDAFYVVRLRSREPERPQALDEVREQVRQAVLAETEQAWFRDNADRTLLTIDGRRFTVGEFWEEYRELPRSFQSRFRGAEGRRELAERLIERWVLIQANRRQVPSTEEQAEAEHARLQILSQMMEQEEVDDKLEVTDEELRSYFEEHRDEIVKPARSRVRYIVMRLGQTEDDAKRAREKADEVYRKLVPGILRKGEAFLEVARQYSEDPLRAQQPVWVGEGPDLLTELTQHELHEQIERLAVGEISEPVEWRNSLHIFEVLEREAPLPLPLEEVEDLLREELRAKKHQQASRRLNAELMSKANVIVYESTLRALGADAALAARDGTGTLPGSRPTAK